MLDKIKDIINKGNTLGIPFPLVRDPKSGIGSVSLTLVFLSFNLVFFGLIGKVTKFIGDVDMTNALWLFGVCCSLYFGRNIKRDGNKVEMSGKDDNE